MIVGRAVVKQEEKQTSGYVAFGDQYGDWLASSSALSKRTAEALRAERRKVSRMGHKMQTDAHICGTYRKIIIRQRPGSIIEMADFLLKLIATVSGTASLLCQDPSGTVR